MNLKNSAPHGVCVRVVGNNPDGSPRYCGMTKMTVEDEQGKRAECPNCGSETPKTGKTITVTEADTNVNGPVKVKFVDSAGTSSSPAQVVDKRSAPRPGFVSVEVPAELFPDLVAWARKLKVPRRWEEAERMQAVVEFQVQINKLLQEKLG